MGVLCATRTIPGSSARYMHVEASSRTAMCVVDEGLGVCIYTNLIHTHRQTPLQNAASRDPVGGTACTGYEIIPPALFSYMIAPNTTPRKPSRDARM